MNNWVHFYFQQEIRVSDDITCAGVRGFMLPMWELCANVTHYKNPVCESSLTGIEKEGEGEGGGRGGRFGLVYTSG